MARAGVYCGGSFPASRLPPLVVSGEGGGEPGCTLALADMLQLQAGRISGAKMIPRLSVRVVCCIKWLLAPLILVKLKSDSDIPFLYCSPFKHYL